MDLHVHSPLSILNNGFPTLPGGAPDWPPYLARLEGSGLDGMYLIVLADEHLSLMDWTGQDHVVRQALLQGCDMVFRNPITPRWVGQVLRRRLGLATVRRRDGYVIPPTEADKFQGLLDRYGLTLPATPGDARERSSSSPPSPTEAESASAA